MRRTQNFISASADSETLGVLFQTLLNATNFLNGCPTTQELVCPASGKDQLSGGGALQLEAGSFETKTSKVSLLTDAGAKFQVCLRRICC